jgi:ornithine carbamoyltransferase
VPVVEAPSHLQGRDFTRVADWSRDELLTALDLAAELKTAQQERREHRLLAGRSVGLLFEKPSLRTRVSFQVGVEQLGGFPVHLTGLEIGLGHRETTRDLALVLSRYLDAIMIRTFAQRNVDEFAEHGTVPVINGLTDDEHPCQALADFLTIRERFGRADGVRIAYIGDGNNVCVSLAYMAEQLGSEVVTAAPPGYEPPPGTPGRVVVDPREAAAGADVLYTDVWTSMGQEAEQAHRLEAFRGYTIDDELLGAAAPDAIVMHCLPAHYGEEITRDVVDGPQSAVWDQAENRLHAQKALLALVVP